MTSCANPYQYLMFVQQWPKSICRMARCSPSARSLLEFKIHGLWPSNFSVYELKNCTGADLDLIEMKNNKSLQSELVKSWPDVKDNDHMKFWGSQYKKHGKCSDNTFPQLEYFIVSNQMWKNYNISKMFESYPKSPIVPGAKKKYSISDLLAAIKHVTKFDPNIRCKNSILSEVVICFNSRGRDVIDCDPAKTCNAPEIEFPG
ncbi:hypothetical protein CerSpe_107200 [Prunus speciosa]